MVSTAPFRWGRVVAAVLAAEAVPILALVLVVAIYGFMRSAGSPPPEQFAPAAGKWVGPLGGFLATLLFARWAAKGSGKRSLLHGMAVGLGTAAFDFSLAVLLGGGGPIEPLLFVSNGGRLAAGVLGGWLAAQAGVEVVGPPPSPLSAE